MRENISRSKSIRREREEAQKFNFRPMLSKKSLHMASKLETAQNRLTEQVSRDLKKNQAFENLECKRVQIILHKI